MQTHIDCRMLVVVLLVGALWVAAHAQEDAARTGVFDELTVQRLNVVAADGTPQVVIANTTRFPLPRLQGRDWPRQVSPAGMVFYDEKGEECGGLATITVPQGRAVRMIFDFSNSEGIGLGTFDDAGESWSSGIMLADRVRLNQDIMTEGTSGTPRIAIQNQQRNASVELMDTQGRVRIRLLVDERDQPRLEILDEDGEAKFTVP